MAVILSLVLLTGCGKADKPMESEEENTLRVTGEAAVLSYTGNGPQWGGYDIVPDWTGMPTLSEEDWETVFKRVSFMRPGFVRIMVSRGWNYTTGGQYDESKSDLILGRILQYCQENDITVQFGEWGHTGGLGVDEAWVDQAVSFLSHMILGHGFTCIKYYTLVNEPNGNWSSTDGDYNLWKRIIISFAKKIEEKGLKDYVEIMGPDVAIWDLNHISWMTGTKRDLHDEVRAYDIHLYPDDKTVYTAAFSDLLDSYRAASDRNRPMTIGELGFKYNSGSILGKENLARIQADKYAADDSQMMVYDSFYGIDMADATIQGMNSGYSGEIYWMLDDAMYNDTGASNSMRLKKWGFWNILGKEKFGNPKDENLRPWFYPISLMCRYFPQGSEIRETILPTPALTGLRAVFGTKNGKHTIAIVNNSTKDYEFTLKIDGIDLIENMDFYKYVSEDGSAYIGKKDGNGFAVPEETGITMKGLAGAGVHISIPAETFILYTNME